MGNAMNVMELTDVEAAVIRLKREHRNTWHGRSDSYWFASLAEEIGELGASLNGEHEHEPELEMSEIASICLNWLERRASGVHP